MDLNADIGEGAGTDEDLLAFVTSVNIACGFHAGGPALMDRTVRLAIEAGLAVGAHPGYNDREGKGRRPIEMEPAVLESEILYQIGALAAFVRAQGGTLTHVKPHGALYHRAASDPETAEALCRAVARAGASLVVVGPYGARQLRRVAEAQGLPFVEEAFADRRYDREGELLPRSHPQALITDPDAAAEQALRIATEGCAVAVDGREISLRAATLCLHGDTPGAPTIARTVRDALHGAGLVLASLGR
jgi:5-oxoprolinase (ATP-hydrolysing) subunit A